MQDCPLPPCLQDMYSRHYALTPSNLVFGRELRLPLRPLFVAPLDKEGPTIHHMAILLDRLHDIHIYPRQHLKLAND
jgi:hypothetical protein